MFGNCPWNLNSSILVNSAAERQAQKRKIRNGQLPMPKLIKTSSSDNVLRLPTSSNLALPSVSDSLLPDTVVISEDGSEEENVLNLARECSHIPCGASKHTSSSVENDSCPNTVIDTHMHCSTDVSESSKLSPGYLRSTVDNRDHGICQLSSDTVMLRKDVCQRGFIDLNDSLLLKKICLEKSDGFILKVGCSEDSNKILTVVQENRITIWESLISLSVHSICWSIKASIPISMTFIHDKQPLTTNEWLLELGLHPSRWLSVVLVFDPKVSKGSVYGCDVFGATRVIDKLPMHPLDYNNKKIYSCLLDSSALVIWGHNEGEGTVLKKFVLHDDLEKLVKENDLVGVESNIQSLHHIDATKPIVVGIDDKCWLFMWNHITGNVIKSVGLFSSEIHSCIGVIEDKGFLFILANGKPGYAHLLAVNICAKKWMVLKTYKRGFMSSISGYTIDGDLLLAAYQDGIVVWDTEAAVGLSSYLPHRKCVPYVFSRDTVFVTDDHALYTLDNSLIFKMERGNVLS